MDGCWRDHCNIPGSLHLRNSTKLIIDFFSAFCLIRTVPAALDYFRQKLAEEPDEHDKPLLAYVLVDLLMRADLT